VAQEKRLGTHQEIPLSGLEVAKTSPVAHRKISRTGFFEGESEYLRRHFLQEIPDVRRVSAKCEGRNFNAQRKTQRRPVNRDFDIAIMDLRCAIA
jgi:methyl coenzyme M reductase subunit C-like uncharacterized protein (methanogenesis marker protein 7)